jgi:hypothetical protein
MVEEEVLSRLVQRIRRMRPQFQERGSWSLLYENARLHTAVSIKQFLAKQRVTKLNNPLILLLYTQRNFFIPQSQINAERENI